jgi:hypothetical protein
MSRPKNNMSRPENNMSRPENNMSRPDLKIICQENNQFQQSLQDPYRARAGLLPESNKLDQNTNSSTESPITYDAGYTEYQQNGLQKQENDISFKNNVFRMGIGEQNVVKPFLQDGKDYYDRLYSYSSSAPTPKESLTNELRYGDFNYISPINKGMTNSDYTFVTPNNWYPVPPHPPVCVTNKRCTTCPIQITDGKDYMAWASLEDFDASRRFTGNMGINIDYVKNVLNNDNGY